MACLMRGVCLCVCVCACVSSSHLGLLLKGQNSQAADFVLDFQLVILLSTSVAGTGPVTEHAHYRIQR